MLNRLNEMVLFVCGGHASKDGDSQGAQEHKNLEEHQVLVGEDKGSDDISDPPGRRVLGATWRTGSSSPQEPVSRRGGTAKQELIRSFLTPKETHAGSRCSKVTSLLLLLVIFASESVGMSSLFWWRRPGSKTWRQDGAGSGPDLDP